MAVLKFRVYLEEDDAIYRDVVIRHRQTFADLHGAVLQAYGFDNRFQATFFRSNDKWRQGREISLAKYEGRDYKAEPLLMADTTIGSEIFATDQKFIYIYDFAKNWTFLIELIEVSKEENSKITYPAITRVEGVGPQQYGTQNKLGDRFVDIEEKYDLSQDDDGYGQEGEDTEDNSEEDGFGGEEEF